MTPEEEKFLFGNLANTQQAPVQQAAPQPVAQQPAPQPVVQQHPVAQQPQTLPQPNVAGLAQQAASAQQVLNQANPAPQAPSAVNSLGQNIGGANFWNIAGALGGIIGTAALANQLFSKNTGINGQEQVTNGRIEPTMAPATDTGFNSPAGQNVPAPSETVSPEQKMVQEHVENVKKEIGKESVPAVPPKVKANEVESIVRSEANKLSKEQEGLSKAVKPKKTAETKSEKTGVAPKTANERAHWPEGWNRGGMGWLVNQYDIEGAKAYIDKHNEGKPFKSHEEALKSVEKTQMRPIFSEIPKDVRKSRGIAPNPQYGVGSKPVMGNAIVPPEQQHGMQTPHTVVLNPFNVFEGINKAKEEK